MTGFTNGDAEEKGLLAAHVDLSKFAPRREEHPLSDVLLVTEPNPETPYQTP